MELDITVTTGEDYAVQREKTMNKQEVYGFLADQGIPYEITEHPPLNNVEELLAAKLPYPEAQAKNLFVRDDKKRHYYIITTKEQKRIDLKAFRLKHELRPLSFASSDDLMSILKLSPGSVTPLGLLNDETSSVELYLDSEFKDLIGVHPNENDATVWLSVSDLIRIIQNHGNIVHLVEMP